MSLVRVLLVSVTIVPGTVVGGVFAYLLLCLFMPSEKVPAPSYTDRHLTRSSAKRKIAGACSGLGEYSGIDPTVVRLLRVVFSLVPGLIAGGVVLPM